MPRPATKRPFTSNDAQIVDFTFSSEVLAPKGDDTLKAFQP